jgi:hypothetical protein
MHYESGGLEGLILFDIHEPGDSDRTSSFIFQSI